MEQNVFNEMATNAYPLALGCYARLLALQDMLLPDEQKEELNRLTKAHLAELIEKQPEALKTFLEGHF